uniref:protein-tyrosine-phosphatase n=1 Tax=Crassostrea virginica TaxID=6565 RepID=A0A8B8B423_CRAVI|nr:uncharacterized protein LOC111107204 isoform X9 [Crassostrea virginica]
MDEPAKKLREALEKFIKHVDDLIEKDDPGGNGFHGEYRELREIATHHKENDSFPADWGKQPYNVKKNRYRDIVPFDDSRVVLNEIEGEEGSDYINASYIQNVHKNDGYIASQGPLPTTVDDFWRMVWELDVRVILMACKEVEIGKKKCARYWPASTDEDEQYGTVHVHLQEENWFADDCVERTLEVKRDGENDRRIVTQFQYTGWPDHGIPDDIDVILTMIAKMREIRAHDKSFAPVVVHCSAGCGRTGTICAVDYSWDVLKCGKLDCDFNLYEIVKYMREQRQSMIQTPDQYEMAHRCVRELFQQHIEALDGNIYANFEPQKDDEYYNVDLDGHTDPNREVDPYETVGVNDSTFKLREEPRKPSVSAMVSILERDALQTIDMYSTPQAFEDTLEALKKVTEAAPRRGSKNRPELQKKPAFIPESNSAGGKPTGYENICDDGKYENMNKTDQLVFQTKQSPQLPKKEKPALPAKKPEDPHKTSGPIFENSGKSGPQFNSPPEKSGPVFSSSLTSKSGPQFDMSSISNFSNTVPNSKSGPQFETSAKSKSGPLFQESTTSQGGPQFSSNSEPSKLEVNYRSVNRDSAPKNKTVITVSSNPRISYVNNNFDDGKKGNNSTNPSRSSNGLPPMATSTDVYEKAKPFPDTTPARSSEGPAVYSQVQKNDQFSRSVGPAQSPGDGVYESITGDDYNRSQIKRSSDSRLGSSVRSAGNTGIYAEVDDLNAPPVPSRGYQGDPAPSSHTIHGMTTLERKSVCEYVEIDDDYFTTTKKPMIKHRLAGLLKGTTAFANLKHNIKDKLNIGNNNEDVGSDTSHIPGFNTRLNKKPGGPKDKPTFWKKILK